MTAGKGAMRITLLFLVALAIASSIRGATGDDIGQSAMERPLSDSEAPMSLYDQYQEVAGYGTAGSTTVQTQTSHNVTANGECILHHYTYNNKHLRCGNRKGLLGRNDQTHHRMDPSTMASRPPTKQY